MSRAKKPGKLISCKLREQIYKELEEYCLKTFIAKTAVIEKALEEYFEKQNNIKTLDKERGV